METSGAEYLLGLGPGDGGKSQGRGRVDPRLGGGLHPSGRSLGVKTDPSD